MPQNRLDDKINDRWKDRMSVERTRKAESASDIHSMIDDTLSKIDKSWMPGALEWMRSKLNQESLKEWWT